MRGNSDEHNPGKDRVDHGRQRRDRQGRGPATGIYVPRSPASTWRAGTETGRQRQRPSSKPQTGRRIFDIVLMDVADLGSVRAGLAGIDGSVDALVMNAGVIGPQVDGLDR